MSFSGDPLALVIKRISLLCVYAGKDYTTIASWVWLKARAFGGVCFPSTSCCSTLLAPLRIISFYTTCPLPYPGYTEGFHHHYTCSPSLSLSYSPRPHHPDDWTAHQFISFRYPVPLVPPQQPRCLQGHRWPRLRVVHASIGPVVASIDQRSVVTLVES